MRRIFSTLLLLLTINTTQAAPSVKDSLLNVLNRTQNPQAKLQLYRNLADVTFRTREEPHYLKLTSQKARETGEQEQLLGALSDLARAYITQNQLDSARYVLAMIEKEAPEEQRDAWLCDLRTYLFSTEVSMGSQDVLANVVESYPSHDNSQRSIYQQLEDAYIVGAGFYTQEQFKKALPYAEKAVELAVKLPFKEGYKYQVATFRLQVLLYTATQQNEQAIATLEKMIGLQERYAAQFLQNRPFFPSTHFLIQTYCSLLVNSRFMPNAKSAHYLKCLQQLSGHVYDSLTRYRCFLAMNNYYLSQEEFAQALTYNDSLIVYALQVAPYNLSGLYDISSQIYEVLDKPAEALEALRTSIQIKDSLQARQTQEKLNELQVKFDVNRLNYEKSQLEIRNKQIMLIGLAILLALVILVCAYLYRNLKKEQEMKAVMAILKQRAEESEKMKTAFTNSICHEIRTPLNAIVGFSDLLLDTGIDEEIREQFPAEIQKSTTLLTSLINSILEVSDLDISDEKLPCEPTDVASICLQEMDALADRISGIECATHIAENPLYICTNARYLALVIENLLSNAGKFTTQGSIILACRRETSHFVMTVTDTGCGIPPDMRETVFDRFTKIDSYKQGGGLGLYLCRLIVKRLGGKIYIDPEYEAGTRMVVELPNECA